ncbi:MAG: TrbG/VirB9 family P-type conjugative transfer protein [Candidatus Omnitrophota bacterium]
MFRLILLLILAGSMAGCATDMSTAKYIVQDEPRIIEVPDQQTQPGSSVQTAVGFEDVSLTGKINKEKEHAVTNAAVVDTKTDNYVSSGTADVIIQPDNTRLYPYGLSQPKLVAAKTLFSVIELQEGEQVLDMAAGDTVRWQTKVSYKGDSAHFTAMVMVKPLMGALTTNLSIVTDRRDYNIIMTSIETGEYMPRIGFYYPQDAADRAKLPVPPMVKQEPANFANVDIENVHFNYVIDGERSLNWYPTSVFDDGKKVFIKMGPNAARSELPVFHVVNKNGQSEVANYRYRKPYYIVDTLFDRGELILGSEKYQTRILIKRK